MVNRGEEIIRIKKRYSQARRFQEIVRVLETRKLTGVTISELAELFGVSRRTIQRDLHELSKMGYPLYDEPGQGNEKLWRFLFEGDRHHTLTFTLSELTTLKFCQSMLSSLRGTPFEDDMQNILQKVETVLPSRMVVHIERLEEIFSPTKANAETSLGKQKEIISKLQHCLLYQYSAVMQYKSIRAKEAKKYRLDPYSMFLYNNMLYLIGYVHDYGEVRNFTINRIDNFEPTRDRFEIPKDFSMEEIDRRTFGIVDDREVSLKVRFSPKIAPYIMERIWHHTQEIEIQPDGGIILTINASGSKELRTWVLSYGDDAELLEPEFMREEIIMELKDSLSNYLREEEKD